MVADPLNNFLTSMRGTVTEISVVEAGHMLSQDIPFFDVREENEFEVESIPGAFTPGRSFLELRLTEKIKDFDTPFVLYCGSGLRSVLAALSVQSIGYRRVMTLMGGLSAWKSAGLPITGKKNFSKDEKYRYSRQMILPEVGVDGQQKLKDAKVLVVGAGGLGAPCLLYLAAAGVGHISIVDHDLIDTSNLQRQVLYSANDVGLSKASIAKCRLSNLNPNLEIRDFRERLDDSNAISIATDHHILVDCSDNFSTRYLVNDTAINLNIPVVYGAIFQYEGQVALLNNKGGPCYRCLYAAPPPKEIAPSCLDAGVLGVVPGLIGIIQATEVIKWILGLDKEPSSTLIYNFLEGSFRHRKSSKRPGCCCGGTK